MYLQILILKYQTWKYKQNILKTNSYDQYKIKSTIVLCITLTYNYSDRFTHLK
jgi:hypothetical protein